MWPILIPVILATFNYLGFLYIPVDWEGINKVIPPVFQIIGGILILYSIDSNLGIAKNTSLYRVFVNYMKSFPLIKNHYTLEAGSGTYNIIGHPAKIRVSGLTNTVEEKIIYLQKQIDWLKEDLVCGVNNINSKISAAEDRATESITELSTKLGSVENKITDLSIGGLKTQIFGVLLMIHGSAVSYYS